jgi:hypothetical protein
MLVYAETYIGLYRLWNVICNQKSNAINDLVSMLVYILKIYFR